jgi:hypothetical protein
LLLTLKLWLPGAAEGKVLLRVELYDKTIGQFAHSGDKVAIDVARP